MSFLNFSLLNLFRFFVQKGVSQQMMSRSARALSFKTLLTFSLTVLTLAQIASKDTRTNNNKIICLFQTVRKCNLQ